MRGRGGWKEEGWRGEPVGGWGENWGWGMLMTESVGLKAWGIRELWMLPRRLLLSLKRTELRSSVIVLS